MSRFALFAFSLLVSLAILEIGLDLAGRSQPEQAGSFYTWSLHTDTGERLGTHPGLLKLVVHPLVGYANLPNQKTAWFSINSAGFRGPEIPAKSPERERVAVLGGSMAFGTGLPSDESTFARGLERQRPASEVVNAAVIGHRSGQELALLLAEVVDLAPDRVIALDGWNDFASIQQPKSARWPDVNGALQVQDELRKLNELVYAPFHVRAANAPQVLLAQTLRRLGLWRFRESDFSDANAERRTEAWQRYARNLVKMARTAAAFGAEFLCVMQPYLGSIHATSDDGFGRFRERVQRHLDAHGVAWLDTNHFADAISPDMFMDPWHLDPRGNAAVAGIVAARLADPGN